MSDAPTNVWAEIISTNAGPDVAEYPSSGKVAIVSEGAHTFFRAGDAVEHAGPEDEEATRPH